MLTTGVDTVPGTAGRDKITGGTSSLTSADTFQVTDQIDGGGGRDTADLTIGRAFAGFTTGSMKGVETVNLTNPSTTAYTFNATGISGVEQYNVSGPINLTAMASLSSKVKLSNISEAQTITVGYADTAVAGTSDKAFIALGGSLGAAPTSSATVTPARTITVQTTGVESLESEVSGNNYVALTGGTATTGVGSLKVTGTSGLLHLTSPNLALKSIDASEFGGSSVLVLPTATATNMSSIKTGTGNDNIYVNAGVLLGDAAVDGGAGTNTLHIAPNAAVTAAYALNNVQIISLLGQIPGVPAAQNANNVTLSLAQSKGVGTVSIGNTLDGIYTISGIGANDIGVSLTPNSTVTGGFQADVIIDGHSGKGSLTIPIGATVAATSAATLSTDNVTFATAPTVEASFPLYSNYQGTITATAATAVTLTGKGLLDSTAALSMPAATSLVLQQLSDRAADAWTIAIPTAGTSSPSALRNLEITQYAGVTLNDSTTDDVSLQSLQSLKVVNEAGAGFSLTTATPPTAGNVVANSLPAVTSVTLSGAKSTGTTLPSVTLGNLGQATNAYDLTVSASGLRGGLTLGTLTTGPGYATTLDLKGKAGSEATTIGTVSTANSSAGSLTGKVVIDATNAPSTGTLTVANNGSISAATVSIDLTGSKFATVNLANGTGSITGNSVTIKANAAATTFDIGTINASDAVTLVGATLVAESGGVSIVHRTSTTDKALAVGLTGSLASDVYTITGMAATSKIEVTGNLGAGGSDTITIDGAARTTTTGAMTIDVSKVTSSGTVATTITGGSGADTITGSTGNDRIIGGPGGDILTGNGGNDVFWLNNPSDSAAISSITRGSGTVTFTATDAGRVGYTFTAGDIFSTVGMDKIMDFGAGDRIVTNVASAATPKAELVIQAIGSAYGVGTTASGLAVTTTTVGSTANTGYGKTVGYDVFVRGSYSNNAFTIANAGPDTLYLFDDNGATADGAIRGIVLVGYRADDFEVTAAASGVTGLLGVAVS